MVKLHAEEVKMIVKIDRDAKNRLLNGRSIEGNR